MTGSKLYLYLSNPNDKHLSAIKNGYLPIETDLDFLFPYLQFDQWWLGEEESITEQDIQQEKIRQYEQLPENVRNFLPFSVFEQQQGQILDVVKKNAKLKKAKSLVKPYNQVPLEKLAVMRLLPSALSHFGWQHWAANFSGICIQLNTVSGLFKSEKGSPKQLGAVKYGTFHHPAPTEKLPFPVILSDHLDLSNLAEWRLAILKTQCKEWQGKPVAQFDKGAIEGIYWSVKTSKETVERIKMLKAQDMRFRQIVVGCVQPDKNKWLLSLASS